MRISSLESEASTLTTEALRWSQEERLRFIEARLFWDGQVNRADLRAKFGTSIPQATLDLRRYAALAPDNLCYDPSRKTYAATELVFAPVFELPAAEAWLNARQEDGLAETIPLPTRQIDPLLLRRLVAAGRAAEALHLKYQPMDQPEPHWCWASPVHFASDHLRWHIRMFNHDTSRFEDWLFPRILEQGDTRPSGPLPPDPEWLALVDVRLVPAARLSPCQRQVVARDYVMVDGRISIPVRLALLFLFWRRLGLDRPDALIDVENRAEVEAMIEALRLRYAGRGAGP